MWCAPADGVEVLEGEIDAGLMGDGEQMQHGVGGPTERHHRGHRILEGLAGHDVPRPQPVSSIAITARPEHRRSR